MKWLLLLLTAALLWPAAAGAVAPGPGQLRRSPGNGLASLATPMLRLLALFLSVAALLALHETLQLFRISRLQALVNLSMAGALVLVLQILLRRRASLWLFAALLLVPLLPQLLPKWGSWWHGLMHTSIVYEVFERGVPPGNPLLAGHALSYPWGHHALIAWSMHAIPISPTQAFVITNVVSLGLFALFVERATSLLSHDLRARVCAVLLALLGPSPFVQTPLVELMGVQGLGLVTESRLVPLSKFIGINSNQIGLACCALAFYALLRIVMARRPQPAAAALSVAVLGAAFLYPVSWLNIASCLGAAATLLLVLGRTRVAAWTTLAIIGASGIIAMPFMLSIAPVEPAVAAFRLDASLSSLQRKSGILLMLASLAMPLTWLGRNALRASARAAPAAWLAIVAILVTSLASFLLVSMAERSEYKFLQMGVIAMSIPLALALTDLWQRRPAVGTAVMIVLALPYALSFNIALLREPVADPVYSDGRIMRHQDPDQDALYRALAAGLPKDAVLVDSHLGAPALARRPLLVGLDLRARTGGLAGRSGTMQDGWLMSAREFLLDVTGVDAVGYGRLRLAASQVLLPAPAHRDSQALETLRSAAVDRPLYLVVRDPDVAARLAVQSRLHRVLAQRAATVYRVDELKRAMTSTIRSQAWPSP